MTNRILTRSQRLAEDKKRDTGNWVDSEDIVNSQGDREELVSEVSSKISKSSKSKSNNSGIS